MEHVFVCLVPFHYYLFRSIYEKLDDAFFIIPPLTDKTMGQYGGGMSGKGLYDFLVDFLNRKNVRVINYGEVNLKNFVGFLSKNVKNVFCPHAFDGIYELEGVRVFKIAYGIPNSFGGVQFNYVQNFICDNIFTFGIESKIRFNQHHLPAVEVGNPLFDYWFENKIEDNSYKQILCRLDKNKKTILYLPTHSYYSSFDLFIDKIIQLSKEYNVIIKVHHMTYNGEANRLCKLLSYPEIIVLGDYFDPLVLYKVADLVLTDVSGALFDALILNKPLLLLKAAISYKVDVFDVSCLPFAEAPEHLDLLIKENIGKSYKLKEKLMYELYHLRDGKASNRIIDIVLNKDKFSFIPLIEKYEKGLLTAPDAESKKRIAYLKDRLIRLNIGNKKVKKFKKAVNYVRHIWDNWQAR